MFGGVVGFDVLERKASCPYYCKGAEDLHSLGLDRWISYACSSLSARPLDWENVGNND